MHGYHWLIDAFYEPILMAGPTYALSDHEGWTDQIARVRVSFVILEVEPGGIVSCGDYCLMFHWNLATACCMFSWDIDHMLHEKLLVIITAVLDTLLAPATRLHLFSGESGNYSNHEEFMPWIVEIPKFRFYLDFDWKIFIDIYILDMLTTDYTKSPRRDGTSRD